MSTDFKVFHFKNALWAAHMWIILTPFPGQSLSYSFTVFYKTKSYYLVTIAKIFICYQKTLRERILPCSGGSKPSRTAPALTQAGVWGFPLLLPALEQEWECCTPVSEWTAPVFILWGQSCETPACRLAPPRASWSWAAFMQRQKGSSTPRIILL